MMVVTQIMNVQHTYTTQHIRCSRTSGPGEQGEDICQAEASNHYITQCAQAHTLLVCVQPGGHL